MQVADEQHIRRLADRLYDGINSKLSGVVLNGPLDTKHRYVGNLNLSFSYVEGESLLMGLKVGPCWHGPHVRALFGRAEPRKVVPQSRASGCLHGAQGLLKGGLLDLSH